jgi:hypothetical protein
MVRAENKKHHIIYRTTNLVNGKFYVGMHSTDNLDDGYMGSGKRILYSLNKWGKANHSFEIVEHLNSRKDLAKREEEIINEEFLTNPLCMNLKLGGQGGFDHFSTEQLLSACSKGGKAQWDRRKDDPIFDSEVRAKKSSSQKKRYEDGHNYFICDRTGLIHTEETKSKMRESHLGKHKAEKNSQYGTCWIFNHLIYTNKKIRKEDLEIWIQDGWQKGRI